MPKLKDRSLTLSEIHSGYHAAIVQARSLVAEAKLLLDHRHVPGAVHRLVIALEELGKARLLFYQGAFTAGGAPPNWKAFWKQYYSHESKLDTALTWLTIEDIAYSDDSTAISEVRAAIVAHAKELDRRKQSTSYSELTEDGFSVPTAQSYVDQVEALSQMAEVLLADLEASPLTTANPHELQSLLLHKFRFARALGYVAAEREHSFDELIARGNQTLWVHSDGLPSDEAFLARVAQRYMIIPERLQVTLPQLRKEPAFARFYHEELKLRRGYPDWIILSTLLNISLNARIDSAQLSDGDAASMMDWRENPSVDGQLDSSTFMDIDHFEKTLSCWVVSFLAGLGILLEDAGKNGEHARRVAANCYGFFNRDVDHEPLLLPEPSGRGESA